jgi:antitoxin HigA-1
VGKQKRSAASTALRLAKVFGTSPKFWLNLQMRWDVTFAQQAEVAELAGIEPLSGDSTETTLFFWQTWYKFAVQA